MFRKQTTVVYHLLGILSQSSNNVSSISNSVDILHNPAPTLSSSADLTVINRSLERNSTVSIKFILITSVYMYTCINLYISLTSIQKNILTFQTLKVTAILIPARGIHLSPIVPLFNPFFFTDITPEFPQQASVQ